MFRFISIWQRKQRFRKDERKTLLLFQSYKEKVNQLPSYICQGKKLLIIRLDDIGDYLLFRNTLPAYRQSQRWQNYQITFLGNMIWKELFDAWDKDFVDDTIWINKREYLSDESYRQNIWQQLRNKGFEIVICPSGTRPLLLDDICRLATGATMASGFANITPHRQWKQISDTLYTKLYHPQSVTHEFFLNQQFANWCCGTYLQLSRPFIDKEKPNSSDYIVCFIGASTRSKRWPERRWIRLINMVTKEGTKKIKVMGVGRHKKEAARIAGSTSTKSITDTTLLESAGIIANAIAIITNDTMAAHLGVSFGIPVVIVATGSNFLRFTEYCEVSITNVKTLYPSLVNNRRKRYGNEILYNHITTTADIATVTAEAVITELKQMLP